MLPFRPRSQALVTFALLAALACNDSSGIDTSGAVRISVTVAGVDRDQDGFEVTVDGGNPAAIGGPGTLTLALDAGDHALALGGLAPNCTPAGQDSVSFTVSPADTAKVAIVVNCVAVTGVVEVGGSATGAPLDLDGYRVTVDGDSAGTLMPNGVLRIAGVPGGTHSIDVSGLAANCTEISPHPVSVEVRVGGLLRDTSRVAVVVNCTPTSGWIRLTASATGPFPDSSYLVAIDGGAPVPLTSGSSLVVGYLDPGSHAFLLTGIAPNCALDGPNPVNAAVVVGDTTNVAFHLVCAATALRIAAATTGANPDTGYLVAVDGGASIPLASGTSVVVGALSPGNHTVWLTGIASNCAPSGPNPVIVSATSGDTTDVAFDVACIAAPPSGVSFIVTTTGGSRDTLYHLDVYGGCGYYCYTPVWQGDVPGNGTVSANLPPGSYSYSVSQVAANCTGPSSGWFDVTALQGAAVALAFTCRTHGSVAVGVQASGLDIDTNYGIDVDGVYRSSLVGAGAIATLDVPVGTHAIGLDFVAPNCLVGGSNPVSVVVDSTSTAHVTFAVSCAANPTLQVSVTTNGANAPAAYLVGVDPDYYYGYSYTASIPFNGGTSIRLPPGAHTVTLDQVPLNCSVTSANNVTVNMVLGSTTNLAFAVTCH